MMASAEPPSSFSIVPLLESLEDSTAGCPEQTDAYLTIANRLSGDEGRQFLPGVTKHFSRLGNAILSHVSSPHAELSQAALQALGFCVYHSHVVSGVSETFTSEILSALCSVVAKSAEKNTCTRALWVISKQNFPADMVGKKVASILSTLESVWRKGEVQSVVMEHEALNVVIRLLEQVPAQMGELAVCWAKLIIPLVVHSASKVRLRAAAAMEMGLPLLLQKQTEVAAIVEPLMSTKLIPELQKLFMTKNEMNVLKLWPLFVKLLGKLLHRGGPFINSLLHLEELGFRSSSPTVKKIAFIAWKSLIDNFALNPDILCSAKRMKLLMQPLMSINIRTEALMLTKVEVWWYLVVQLGPNLSSHFDLVSLPLLQCTISSEGHLAPATPAKGQNGIATPNTLKSAGPQAFNSLTPNASRLNLNSSMQLASSFPSIKLLGLEMLLHYFLGPEVVATATENKLVLTLEPLRHPLLSATSSFSKHAAVLISNIKDGFKHIGKDAPDALLALLWDHLVHYVTLTIESGIKKDRNGSEVLTLTLQALQNIVCSEALPADKLLVLFESTVKGMPSRVLGSASYQVGKMDVLNGTPALFLILLLLDSKMLASYIEDARFYHCFQTLVGCSLSGPTSPLAFAEAVLGAIARNTSSLQSKEHLLRMWSVVVAPLTDTITQSNEVNQGDALEHNFSAMHSALMFPVTYLLSGSPEQQVALKSMLSSWSKLYKVFARCSALVVTAEENICCEELCVKMAAKLDRDALTVPSTLTAFACMLQVIVECVDFSPYTPQFQQKLKSPHTPVNWTRKRSKALGNLFTFHSLLVQCLDVYLAGEDVPSETTGMALLSVLSTLFTNLVTANAVKEALSVLIPPLVVLYKQATCEPPRFTTQILGKMEKLLSEVLVCIQSRSNLANDDDLLALLSPLLCVLFLHKNKQHRTAVTHFWNSTFANAVGLIYPDELRPVLSQVKQKIPIILPGFETVSVAEELSGQFSSESSQLETKLSGVPVVSTGKRDSWLVETAKLSDQSSPRTSKPVSTKLDFGSPKALCRKVLDEEASVDFVFIPPEPKERVLTEHQKEVKRTKRGDIPAMYNNLDASLDATAFTQYTQSQEDSLSHLTSEDANKVAKEASAEPSQETNRDPDAHLKETRDFATLKALESESAKEEQEIIPESMDISMEEDVREDEDEKPISPNMSSSSDLISGTPQSSSGSRRQSFITLEKYNEGKPASPSSASFFTGTLVKTSGSLDSNTPSPKASQKPTEQNSQPSSEALSKYPASGPQESPQRPIIDTERKFEPIRLSERLTSNESEVDDVIPDTQTENVLLENTVSSASDDMRSSNLEEDSQDTGNDSQFSESFTSPAEPRHRKHSKHLLPGESPVDSSTPQNRPNTRSKVASEEESRKIQLRSQRNSSVTSQTKSRGQRHKVRLYSNTGNLLTEGENKKRRSRSQESSQTDLPVSETVSSQCDPQSVTPSNLDRRRRRKRGRSSKCVLKPKEEVQRGTEQLEKLSSQTDISPDSLVDSEGNSQEDCSQPFNGLQDPKGGDLKPASRSAKMSIQSDTLADSENHSQQNCDRLSGSLLESKEDSQISEKSSSQTDLKAHGHVNQESEVQHDLPTKPLLESKEDDPMNPEMKSGNVSSQIDLESVPEYDTERQTRGKIKRTSKSLSESDELNLQLMSTQPDSQSDIGSDTGSQTPRKRGRPSKISRRKSKVLSVDQTKTDEHKSGSQIAGTDGPSQEIEPVELGIKLEKDSHKIASFTNDKIQEEISAAPCILSNRDEVAKDEPEAELSQDSQEITPASIDLPQSKASPEVAEDKSIPKALSRKQSKSPSQENSPAENKGRARRRKVTENRSESSAISTPESSQSLDVTESLETPQGRGSRRRSSRVFADSTESLESELSEAKERYSVKGRKSQGTSPSLATGTADMDLLVTKKNSGDPELLKAQENSPKTQDPTVSEPPEMPKRKSRARISRTQVKSASPPESDTGDLESSKMLEPEETAAEESQENLSLEVFAADTQTHPDEAKDKLQVSEFSSEETTAMVVEPTKLCNSVNEKDSVDPEEKTQSCALGQKQEECSRIVDELLKAAECSTTNIEKTLIQILEDGESLHEDVKDDNVPLGEFQDEEPIQMSNTNDNPEGKVCIAESTGSAIFQDSPAKLKDLEAELMPDLVQSPCSNRAKGTWSPSASPSMSILKKGQKRPVEEEETPSPIVKSRRVSFANPIQRQETADDIDRRSPAVRTSSPKRTKVANLLQPKFVTTPTKGTLPMSPRNLHSPNFRSSKKCLISKMSQERQPVSKNCIYPSLVGCGAPIEAVLPQISSSIWSRGFGHIVRARNIKTVGDLSALTPNEIKTLPIHSPKISNVKNALKSYEQQRKGRGVDELKSFVEMEMMTSEPEETSTKPNQDEDEKPADILATELTDEPSAPAKLNEECTVTSDSSGSGVPEEPGLQARLDALDCAVAPPHLSDCSPQQLSNIHEHLALLMRRVMFEMQSRLTLINERP
ncbi:telomere-associated protein RIF1 isoform X1 [Syngnathus acus]|uniref:telomere-associated protein RIF1 isoform X1 n=1 Tax=Syngnathus acus TaxID=161584 RepID=UPI001885AEB7|nr:telomere-associated protein RIF1 isoform X1 [Syngnathus acus]XP_037095121.1 telomere-associated protein RIF1 isoform X1 [Syngnathus acus]